MIGNLLKLQNAYLIDWGRFEFSVYSHLPKCDYIQRVWDCKTRQIWGTNTKCMRKVSRTCAIARWAALFSWNARSSGASALFQYLDGCGCVDLSRNNLHSCDPNGKVRDKINWKSIPVELPDCKKCMCHKRRESLLTLKPSVLDTYVDQLWQWRPLQLGPGLPAHLK